MRSIRRACVALLLPAVLAAQGYTLVPRFQREARVDALFAGNGAVQLGLGANVPVGFYARLGLVAAAGVARHEGGGRVSGRLDATARWLLDPFGEFRWGPYAGAGLTVRAADRERWRGSLLVVLGVEGRASRRWRTSVEAGLGDGARIGIAFRRARQNGR